MLTSDLSTLNQRKVHVKNMNKSRSRNSSTHNKTITAGTCKKSAGDTNLLTVFSIIKQVPTLILFKTVCTDVLICLKVWFWCFKQYHSDKCHLEVTCSKTFDAIRQKFYWPIL